MQGWWILVSMISTTDHTTLVFNPRWDFDHNNPNSFIENDNIKVFIQALHDAESLDHLHTMYNLQKLNTRTLRAALTLQKNLVEKAKLRVHDLPSKDNN
jgi:hypothetical protein